jgi:hypothetical protein
VTVTAGLPPVANNVSGSAIAGQGSTINVLANVTSPSALNTSSLVVTTPTFGTASINSSNSTISYIPKPNFVGTDSFTYSITNVVGQTSTATVSVDVGTTISSARGATRSLSFTDSAGGLETISLSSGSAELFFSGTTGTVSVTKAGAATVKGDSSLAVSSIVLSGTTRSSSLVVRGNAKKPTTVGGITDSSPLGSISASSMILSGTVNLNSVGTLVVDSLSNAAITIGSGLPGRVSITTGAVTNSALTSSVPITTLRASSWSGGGVITAPSIASLTVAGEFDASLALNSLAAGRVGAVGNSAWNINSSTGSVTVTSFASGWNGSLGAIRALTVKTGGLATGLAATAISSLVVTGNLDGNITASSAKLIRINGDISNAAINVTGSVGQLIASGTIGDETITVGGNMTLLSAGSINASNISAGVVAGTTFANISSGSSTGSTLGGATISQIRSKHFTESAILADKITTAALGDVVTTAPASTGTPAAQGIAVNSINSFSGVFSGSPLLARKADLINTTVLNQFALGQAVTLNDFGILIGG